jgi:threonine dehydratase
VLEGVGFDESLAAAEAHVTATGATFVHAFEDERVIAGQGTIGLELAEQLPVLETVVIPIGGGGLAAGIAIALRELRPDVCLVGVQAEAIAPLAGGTEHGYTIAEGIAVKQPGELTSAILRELLDDVVTVTDEQISHAIVLLLERLKLLVEGAGAASVAAVLAGKAGEEGDVCAILSGGNIDATLLIQVMRHGLSHAGRYLVVRTRLGDRPGELIKLLQLVAEERGNVVSVEHHREGMELPIGQTEVELTLAMRDEAHCDELRAALAASGYPAERMR